MDCCAFCSAATYMIKPLYERMRISYKANLYRDVLHLFIEKEGCSFQAFFFPYGVSVFWGAPKELGLKMIQEEVEALEQFHCEDLETDLFTYSFGDIAKIVEDEITLPNEDVLTKLAVSHGIAQSVKLGTFESSIQKTYNSTKKIPENLVLQGKIPLSRKEIRRKMGELFISRNSINLHMDVLDTPEFFWEYPELEPLYMLTANYLDISRRVEVLNQRMDVIHGLFEMLGNELNHLHSSRLEMTIILLIVIEVLIALMRDVFHLI
jgi:uncharacterized Rmd1/YagE family protein